METIRTENILSADAGLAVSWGSIAAGAVASAALTLLLLAFGAGIGLSSMSPWSDAGVSASTFKVATGIYLVIVGVMASAIGGYLAARLRTKWTGAHTNEVFFRDTAHGFIAWAFATVLSASVLASAATYAVGGVAASAAQAGQNANPSQVYVDRLFRTDSARAATSADPGGNNTERAQVTRLWMSTWKQNVDFGAADRAFVVRVVAAETGMSEDDAAKHVNDVIAQAKDAVDRARSNAAQLSLWLTASLLFGAFAASLAAVEGGQLRDGTWNDRRLVPRPWR